MKYFLTLILLLLTLLPSSSAKKIDANPINIAVTLVEKTDSAKVASTLEYYGYTPQGIENGYCVMKNTQGNEIRFSFNDNGTHSNFPTILVKLNITEKDLNTRLKDLDFEKSGNGYQKAKNAYSRYTTQCSTSPHNTLTFRRVPR